MRKKRHNPKLYEVTIDGKLHRASDKAEVRDLLAPYRRHPDRHMVDIIYRPPGEQGRTPKWADVSQGGDLWWDL